MRDDDCDGDFDELPECGGEFGEQRCLEGVTDCGEGRHCGVSGYCEDDCLDDAQCFWGRCAPRADHFGRPTSGEACAVDFEQAQSALCALDCQYGQIKLEERGEGEALSDCLKEQNSCLDRLTVCSGLLR